MYSYFSLMQEEYTIYVIDNDQSVRNGITRLLNMAGYHLREFSSAEECFDCFNSDGSGCMIIDSEVLGEAFSALLNKLNAHGVEHHPIIVISGEDSPDARRKAAKIKAVGFFRKPVDGSALIDSVNWAISSRISDSH